MLSSGVPNSFLGAVVMTTCYLTNMTPSVALNCHTSCEIWYSKCADCFIVRTFGCTTFSHQSGEKLEPRVTKCVFLGYLEKVKKNRLWIKTRKM